MSELKKHPLELFTSTLKDLVSAMRDSVFFLMFILLLVTPDFVNRQLTKAGFTGGSIAGMEWKAQAKALEEKTMSAGQTVDQASQNYNLLIERLGNLEKKVADPQIKSEVKSLSAVAESSQQNLVMAEQSIRRSLAVQQQAIAKNTPMQDQINGWIFLGKVSEDKKVWAPGSPITVRSISTDFAAGTPLTIRDDVYLRADSASAARSSAAILGAAKAGDEVTLLAADYSHAKGGGWFVWARIQK